MITLVTPTLPTCMAFSGLFTLIYVSVPLRLIMKPDLCNRIWCPSLCDIGTLRLAEIMCRIRKWPQHRFRTPFSPNCQLMSWQRVIIWKQSDTKRCSRKVRENSQVLKQSSLAYTPLNPASHISHFLIYWCFLHIKIAIVLLNAIKLEFYELFPTYKFTLGPKINHS